MSFLKSRFLLLVTEGTSPQAMIQKPENRVAKMQNRYNLKKKTAFCKEKQHLRGLEAGRKALDVLFSLYLFCFTCTYTIFLIIKIYDN
jgi:hypothetical protein